VNVSNRTLVAALAAALATLAAGPARAGFPGTNNLAEAERVLLRYVCSNAPQTQCVEQDPFGGGFTASECPASPAPTCAIDYVPNAEIRALLTVIADDRTGEPPSADPDVRTTVMLEFKIGNDSYAIADFFQEDTTVGDWFFVPSEADIFHFDFGGGALLSNRLSTLGSKLKQIGAAHLGVPSLSNPVIVEGLAESPVHNGGTPKPQELETNQSLTASGSNPGQPLASIARYRVTIKFARTP
jgi:hypothetical protein